MFGRLRELAGTDLLLECSTRTILCVQPDDMKSRLPVFASLAVVVALCAAAAWTATAPRKAFSSDDPRLAGEGDAERGRLVFAAGDCASCHASPGQADRLHLGGGLALASPFGMFRVPNLSSDPNDGIGSWSTADLANAMVAGVSPRGQHYYPVFPYTSYTGMKLDDIKDLRAFLRTLPAVAGKSPPHDLPLLFRIRRAVGAWKLLFFDQQPKQPPPSGDPLHDRGRYLAETAAHCSECHSSRNVFAAIRPNTRYAGGPDPEGVGFIPNITPTRIGQWSEADIVRVLTDGHTPDHGIVGSSMVDVVTNTAMLPPADREAIARYIKSLPSRPTPHP